MGETRIKVRRARTDEARALTALALRAKASWGYDKAFMAACRAELTLTPEKMAAWSVWVAECEDRVAGMITLSLDGGAEVQDFFVEPAYHGRGVGRALMETLLSAARAAGAKQVEVDADPHAEAIYARLGFRTFSRSPSGSIPGRWLPRMALSLPAEGRSGGD